MSQQVLPGRPSRLVVTVVGRAAAVARGSQLISVHVTLVPTVRILTLTSY